MHLFKLVTEPITWSQLSHSFLSKCRPLVAFKKNTLNTGFMFQTWSCLHVLSRLQKRRDLSVCRCVQRPLFCRCLWWSATVTSTVFMMITTCMREYHRHFCSVIKDLLSSGNRNSVRGSAVTRELFSLQKFIWPSVQIPVLQSHWCEWSRSSSPQAAFKQK